MNMPLDSARLRAVDWSRWLVLLCTLVAFSRLAFDLDAKPMWWDESLSLQRAEQAWSDILRGRLVLWDGENERVTWDQHPFGYYLPLASLMRLVGDSVFALRFLSLCATTLLVPAVWGFTRFLERRRLAPQATANWAAVLAALSPFALWYGQEARPYALWMLVSLLAFWWLWEWMDSWRMEDKKFRQSGGWAAGYLLAMLAALCTHFYALMMIPIHGVFVFVRMQRFDRKLAVEIMTFLLFVTGGLVVFVYQYIMGQPGAGSNYAPMGIGRIMREIMHAFGTGLSASIDRVGWLDLIFLALAGYGIWYTVRSPESRKEGGWFVGAFLLIPVVGLFAVSIIQPNFMAARHHAQLLGVYLILVASGLAALTRFHQRATVVCSLLLIGGMGYSSYRYFEAPIFQKAPDYALVGQILDDRLREDDLVIFKGPNSWRLFRYYFPMAEIERARENGVRIGWAGMPHIRGQIYQPVEERMLLLTADYERIWLLEDRTLPYEDPRGEILSWLREHKHSQHAWEFFHPNSSLALFLFLPEDPNPLAALPAAVDYPVEAVFGDMVRLRAVDVNERLWASGQVPLTLYWEYLNPVRRPMKYIAWLVEERSDGSTAKLPHTEQVGTFSTEPVPAGTLILDFSHVEAPRSLDGDSRYLLHVMLYQVEDWSKVPVTEDAGFAQKSDEPALIIPIQVSDRS